MQITIAMMFLSQHDKTMDYLTLELLSTEIHHIKLEDEQYYKKIL